MQHELRDECCLPRAAGSAAPRNLAAPDENVELAKRRLLGVGKPRDTNGACRGLEETASRCAMLLDRAFQLLDALQHTFGGKLIEERCHRPLIPNRGSTRR